MGSTRREFVRNSSVAAAAIVGLAAVPAAARVAHSKGLFAYTRGPAAALITTVRTSDGAGSGWAGASHHNLGMQVVDARVTLLSDPFDPDAARSPFIGEGLPTRRRVWILNDVVKNLNFDRYWTQKTGVSPTASGGTLTMSGGSRSMEEMIASTSRGKSPARSRICGSTTRPSSC